MEEPRKRRRWWTAGEKKKKLVVLIWTVLFSTLLSGCSGQQQSFRVRPSDVESKVGDTAVIRCEVDNQVGPAQWTRRAFALGFDRSLPLHPRLSMVGDGEKGVHNLRIENVTLSDIGEYQCQIGPGTSSNGKGNKPIRADARLNVLVPPVGVELLGHASDATITLKEKESTELECVVGEARPAATVIWFKNDQVLRTETREDTLEGVEYKVEDGLMIVKNRTRSKIRFFPGSEDDRARYACEARHPALTRPLRTSVVLSVQYAPGAPQILGYVEGETIKENQSMTLTCVSRGGNPLAELIWYKNDVRIDSSYATVGKESRNDVTFIANTKDNLSRFRCEATNLMSPRPKIADVVLTVMFAPREVTISGPTEATVGDSVTLECHTSNSNPRAEVQWFRGGLALVQENLVTTSSSPSSEGGWTTSSNVTVRVRPGDTTIVVTCQGINRGLSESKVVAHTINVIQPPGPPLIYKASMNVNEGHLHKVTCTSTGGHPPPTLQWFRENKKVNSSVERVGNVVQSELSLVANASDNGVTYRCEAKNKAVTAPLSESITFHVLFPPRGVSITVRPRRLREGEKGYLTCESGSSNPPAKVSWLRDGMAIPSLGNGSRDGEFGGKRSVTTLELDLTSELDNVVYTCQAYNSAVKKSVHDATTLQVAYKPRLLEGPVGGKVTVVEGGVAVLGVKAKGNPDTVKYKWMRVLSSSNGSSSSNQVVKTRARKVFVDGGVVNFTEVSRKDRGKYVVEASNSEGTATFNVDLDVQYAPTVTSGASLVEHGEGDVAHLSCAIDANPLDASMVKWSKNGGELNETNTRTRVSFSDDKSYLTIEGVDKSDVGTYTCSVDNGVVPPSTENGTGISNSSSSSSSASVFLVVKQAPEMDESVEFGKGASNKGGTGRLVCRAKGAPNVTFSWAREGTIIQPSPENQSGGSKYSVQYRKLSAMEFESVLEVHSVTSGDYGLYECVGMNELGSGSRPLLLDVTSVPESPVGLRVVNYTHDSVTLAWSPGFNGGFPQKYRVKFWRTDHQDQDSFRYEDVPSATKSSNGGGGSSSVVFTVGNLDVGREYAFAVVGVNKLGEGNYTRDTVSQETKKLLGGEGGAGGGSIYAQNDLPPLSLTPLSRLVILVFVVVGGVMLLINVFLIGCFIKRRSKNSIQNGRMKQQRSISAASAAESNKVSSRREEEVGVALVREDVAKVVIIGVSTVGVALLVLNILVVSWFIYKKRERDESRNTKKCVQNRSDNLGGSDEGGSSKSATIEMYAPSSYNETVNGETLSSISEKSGTYAGAGNPGGGAGGPDEDDEDEDDIMNGGVVGGRGGYLYGGDDKVMMGSLRMQQYLLDDEQQQGAGGSSASYYGVGHNNRASTLPRKFHQQQQGPGQGFINNPHEDYHHHPGGAGTLSRISRIPPQHNHQQFHNGTALDSPVSPSGLIVPPIPELFNIPPEARYVVQSFPHHHTHHQQQQQQHSQSSLPPHLLSPSQQSVRPPLPSGLSTFGHSTIPEEHHHQHEGHLV